MEEVKIQKIDVKNLKAVTEFTALFNGKCAHVTGANGIGKSTVIRAFTDRLRGLKPSIITTIGEEEGKTVMELTDGCRFEWKYNDKGKDELNYFTPYSLKPVRRDVFKHICGQYFPNQFDINKFLTTTEPRKRLQMISELVDVDLTEVQARYKDAFEERKDAKKELKILQSQIKPKPEEKVFDGSSFEAEEKKVSDIKIEIENQSDLIESIRGDLNSKYLINKKANEETEKKHQADYQVKLDEWLEEEEKREDEVNEFNSDQIKRQEVVDVLNHKLNLAARELKDSLIEDYLDEKGAIERINKLPQPEELKEFTATPKPEFKALELPDPMPSDEDLQAAKSVLSDLEIKLGVVTRQLEEKKAELSDLNASKQVYELQLKQFNDYQKEVQKQLNYVQECEESVMLILNEIKDIISKTKLPKEFSIDLTNRNDILFRTSDNAEYLPITNETLASSAIFIAAFKLQANYLEAFRVAHFDVSYLDYENRQKVLQEAISMNIQLITESPAQDKSGKELQYKITED
jgi:hypothetical protein